MGSGVASFVIFLFLLRIPWENAVTTSQVCPKRGLRRDCDRFESPAGKNRVCLVHDTRQVQWYSIGSGSGCRQDFSKFCPGYVGMNMNLTCVVTNASQTVIYKDGMPFSDGPTATFFNGLQAEDEGLYQCRRRGSPDMIYEFNMTVQSEVHIGGASSYECASFFCDRSPISQRKCCYHRVNHLSSMYYSEQPVGLSVYGDAPINISLAVEWITNSTVHYPTDLSPYINRIPTNPIGWEMNFRHFPHNLIDIPLEAAIVVTATNNISSSSVCIAITFEGTNRYNANTSLPQETNTTVGGNATFVCEFGSNDPNTIFTPLISFDISLDNDDGNTTTTFTTRCQNWEDCDDWSPDQFAATRLSITPINENRKSNFIQYRYEVQLINVAQEFNGSQFSCSISTGSSVRVLQWRGTGGLTVEASPVVSILSAPPTATGGLPTATSAITAAAVVLFVVILALAVAISLLLATFKKRRSKRTEELAQVPLTTLPTSTVVSQSTTSSPGEQRFNTTKIMEQHGLPAISIMDVGGVPHDIVIGREVLHETRSTDSGVSCTEYDGERRTLGMTRAQQLKILENRAPVRLCRSETNILDSTPLDDDGTPHTPRKKAVIYISYTDHASQWVRSTLKPMIDSWEVADVMLPERDMVAGKAISNERRRLIVEADKIIVVISPDYYNSEWCSYELMHAIQNEPTLSRGRIIPILIDGCKLVPKNMEVVVPLFAHEADFSQRLRAAIYPHSTARLSLQ